MRKIIVREMLTVDGFFCGPNGEIDWHRVDAEFNEESARFLDTIDLLIFGRVTYDLMASWWPKPEGMKDSPLIAAKMNALPKLVFSKTVEKAGWQNTTMRDTIDADEIAKLKAQPGKDIAIFGSGIVVAELARLGLVDEYWFIVNPIILGTGKTLFATVPQRHELKFLGTKPFANGNARLSYASIK